MAELATVSLAVEGAPPPEDGLKMQANGVAPAAEVVLERYKQERQKRLRDEGEAQYIDPAFHAKLQRFQADCWVNASTPNPGLDKAKDGDRYTVALLGAGFASIVYASRLIKAGIQNVVLLDQAGGFGGTWYWNRYPGLMCDVESYIYLPLLEETGYVPKHRYSYGHEIREYAEILADKYDLRDKAIFRVKIDSLTWDERQTEWKIKLNRLDGNRQLQIQSAIVISNPGLISIPKMPNLPGMNDFEGHSFHTSRWDYNYTGGIPTEPDMINLKDKRVGIIGTGATAIQAVPELGKWAQELYIFQRTPSSVDSRGNRATDPEWFNREVRGSGKGWQRRRAENFNLNVSNAPIKLDLVSDEWTRMRTFSCVVGTPNKVSDIPTFLAYSQALDLPRQEKIRKRVEATVRNKETAEKLKPWYSGWCKRPCFHDEYLQTFNRPNVKLVDTQGRGVDKITKIGAVVAGVEYPLDVIIFGTGYYIKGSSSPAGKGGYQVYGKGGLSLDDKWEEGVATLHGIITDRFPNLFFQGPNQAGASANMAYMMDVFSEHITYIISEASKRAKERGGNIYIEPSQGAEEEWAKQITARAGAFAALSGCTPGYMNAEGAADKPKSGEQIAKAVKGAFWGEGIHSFVQVINQWRNEGTLEGLVLEPDAREEKS